MHEIKETAFEENVQNTAYVQYKHIEIDKLICNCIQLWCVSTSSRLQKLALT